MYYSCQIKELKSNQIVAPNFPFRGKHSSVEKEVKQFCEGANDSLWKIPRLKIHFCQGINVMRKGRNKIVKVLK